MRIGYVAIISVALISTLLTGYMLNQYITTYSLVMKTEIDIEATHFDYSRGEPVLNLSVRIVNPNQVELQLHKIEFDLRLNQKYMEHQVIMHIPLVNSESQTNFIHSMILPQDRMFTIEDAQEQGADCPGSPTAGRRVHHDHSRRGVQPRTLSRSVERQQKEQETDRTQRSRTSENGWTGSPSP